MEITFGVAIGFLCSLGLSFSKLENSDEKSPQLYLFYTKNKAISNSSQNISPSFGSETMRSVIEILYKHKQSQEKLFELYRTGLNNTSTSDQSYMIFNRNAKSGSETLQSIISRLSKTNNFTMVTDWNSATIMSEEQRRYFFYLWTGFPIRHTSTGKYNRKGET